LDGGINAMNRRMPVASCPRVKNRIALTIFLGAKGRQKKKKAAEKNNFFFSAAREC
jgi:hypothetical protein